MNLTLIEQVSAELAEILGDDFDPATFWDTLDGETDVMDLMGHLIRERVEAQAHEKASKEAAAVYAERARRMADKSRAMTKAMGRLLDATDQKKLAHPLATISRTSGRMSCRVTDESAVPTQLTIRKPDTAAIKRALEAGEGVPGAELVRGEDGVTVRIK